MDDTAPQRTRTVRVTSTQALGHGPIGRFPTRRVHRRSGRTVADLPWGAGRVVLPLQGRQGFCAKGRCTRRICTERLAPRVAPWARRTPRLTPWLGQIAVALAGTAGARVSRGRGRAVSRHTLLRLLRRQPLPEGAPCPSRKPEPFEMLDIDSWRDHP